MSKIVDDLKSFQAYASLLDGDEKGEAQVFCDRLFKAFGHDGYKEAGAALEFRIKKKSGKGTSFADLIWKPRLLLEMKKRGEKLQLHYYQAFDYWLNAVPNRPRYVVLCNFDEFWIYDFDRQLDEPVDRVPISELSVRYTALNFLFPEDREPIFNNDREAVSRRAADQTAELFRHLVARKKNSVSRQDAQRFVLQLVISMFAEDIDMLPAGMVTSIIRDCLDHKMSSYDLLGGLFRQMNNPHPAKAGRYLGVPYFNGGLFSAVEPIDLTVDEMALIGGKSGVATKDWSKVNPAIFGTLFQQSMDEKVRHQHGRHFTSEADIQRVVGPCIVRPWQTRIDAAKGRQELLSLRRELAEFRVLDPACGSGNFLYVAFRELARLDMRLMMRLKSVVSRKEFLNQAKLLSAISPRQFFGIDNDPFGVELAKVTLMLAKKLALDEAVETFAEGEGEFERGTREFAFHNEEALPLDNLDNNLLLGDALFMKWPDAEVVVGNPPYQSKNKLQKELGPAYLHKLRARHPEVDGRADYCVYWYRLAHDHLKDGQFAGLVGTNTIRQNYSRHGGLDYIVDNGGTITEAVSSMIWPGKAVVHVSIANWTKGAASGPKRLYLQEGNILSTGWRHADLERIPSSLSFALDVTKAKKLVANTKGGCHQGQTHGHEGFLVEKDRAESILRKNPSYSSVLKPFMISDDLMGEDGGKPSRYVIDFSGMDLLDAKEFPELISQIEKKVLPDRIKAAQEEAERNKELFSADPKARGNKHHQGFLKRWWQMSYSRAEMISEIGDLPRYIACGRVTKRPIFEFVSPTIQPNDALTVFTHADDYTFGILQSSIHWLWFVERCSTIKSDPRYTSNTVFDSFPWPQEPSARAISDVAEASVDLRQERRRLMDKHGITLRELYKSMEQPGDHPLKDATAALDDTVRKAFGMGKKQDSLQFLLELNGSLADLEESGKKITPPGLPKHVKRSPKFITDDCIEP